MSKCRLCNFVQDQSENTHDGDLYDDVITSRSDSTDEVCYLDVWMLYYSVIIFH